jgi:hypothetical protein
MQLSNLIMKTQMLFLINLPELSGNPATLEQRFSKSVVFHLDPSQSLCLYARVKTLGPCPRALKWRPLGTWPAFQMLAQHSR